MYKVFLFNFIAHGVQLDNGVYPPREDLHVFIKLGHEGVIFLLVTSIWKTKRFAYFLQVTSIRNTK